jgi:hypothetical protein
LKLFDVVPGNFFSILSSGNRELHYDALMILHEMFRYELNIRVVDYIASLIAILENRSFEIEGDEEPQEGGLTLSAKARLILDRLIKTGWVDKEFLDSSFIEIITPRNYAIPVMRLLSELGDDTLQEYNSLVFATYSGLKHAMSENQSHLYEALLSAKSNTEHLQYSLRTLYHAIRGFLRGIAPQQEVNTLLEEHFLEYKKMSDRIYHPIKTMDSVHRYMVPIQSLLADLMSDDHLMRTMRDRAISIRSYSEEDAEEEIQRDIDFIMDFYQAVGGLVSEIDRKHSNFTKSSIEKIQYLMTADHTIKGKLAEVLTLYSSGSEDEKTEIAGIMESHIYANRQEFFDEKSLYHRNVRNRRIDRDALSISLGDGLSSVAKDFLMERIASAYTKSRIKEYLDGLFTENADAVYSESIRIADESEFIMLILALIRQGEDGLPYKIEILKGQAYRDGYIIPNMKIRREQKSGEHTSPE